MKKRKWRARRDSNSRPSGSKRNFGLDAVQTYDNEMQQNKGNSAVCFAPFCTRLYGLLGQKSDS